MVALDKGRGAAWEPVINVTDLDFDTHVIRASHSHPVAVDFWASWCGPCLMLSPLLERLAGEAAGAWQLAKVNVDAHQALAARYDVQGIPAVKGFRGGEVVAEFVGAQPEPAVRQFLERLLPSAADELVAEARARELAVDFAASETLYRSALREEAAHPTALLGLGRVLAETGRHAEALDVLRQVPRGG